MSGQRGSEFDDEFRRITERLDIKTARAWTGTVAWLRCAAAALGTVVVVLGCVIADSGPATAVAAAAFLAGVLLTARWWPPAALHRVGRAAARTGLRLPFRR